jgi:very-short-patch-repair endonuclease
VDCVWREARLIVELDGERYHGSRSRRQADRERDNRLMAAGWRVIRITWDDLKNRPVHVVGQIRTALSSAA